MKLIVNLSVRAEADHLKTLDLIQRLRQFVAIDGVMITSSAKKNDTYALLVAQMTKDANKAFEVGLRLSEAASASKAAMDVSLKGLDFFSFACASADLLSAGESIADLVEANPQVKIYVELDDEANDLAGVCRTAVAQGFIPVVQDCNVDMSRLLILSVATGGEISLAIGSDPEKAALDYYDFAGCMFLKEEDLGRHESLLMRATADKMREVAV